MKRPTYLLIALLTLTSCEKWLDVMPNTDVPAKELFTSENGFTSALAGLYITMTDESTYGKNLSFGLPEQLAQFYDKLPDGTSDRTSVYIYDRETSGAYNTKGTLANTWQAQYHIIANANNLLKWCDLNGAAVLTDITHRMIRGEALAMRAYLHFDILRGWGPMHYAANDKAKAMKCMPYRTVADHTKQPLLTASEVVSHIIADLHEARQEMSYENTLDLSKSASRQFRFNYHAINALLARVYNYAGISDSAAIYAKMVIDECGLSLQSSNDNDPILSREVICGLSMHELEDNLSDYFAYGDKMATKYYLNISTLNALYESVGSESEDMRAQGTASTETMSCSMPCRSSILTMMPRLSPSSVFPRCITLLAKPQKIIARLLPILIWCATSVVSPRPRMSSATLQSNALPLSTASTVRSFMVRDNTFGFSSLMVLLAHCPIVPR